MRLCWHCLTSSVGVQDYKHDGDGGRLLRLIGEVELYIHSYIAYPYIRPLRRMCALVYVRLTAEVAH